MPAAPPASGAGAALPVAAVPTTLSGAEFTSAFTVHEPAAGRSVAYFHPAARPVLVIHDALVLASTPPPLIAASGMNSLAHAIEHYASPYGSRICRFANREAFALSFAALTRLAAVPGDVGALDDALAGSALSEMDHPNTPVGLTHAVAHAVTARRDCAHGLAYAVLLPPCLAYTRPAAEPDFAVLARLATGAAAQTWWPPRRGCGTRSASRPACASWASPPRNCPPYPPRPCLTSAARPTLGYPRLRRRSSASCGRHGDQDARPASSEGKAMITCVREAPG